MKNKHRVLVTGATGYVGGRLVPHLLEAGWEVSVLTRDPRRLQGRSWINQVQAHQGDVLEPNSLDPALKDVQAAYYLIHSMGSGEEFIQRDIEAARNFGTAAKKAGVQRIIYLGGLGNPETDLSKHLRSRQLTGDELRNSGVPVIEFQAAIIVGSGSISFEMIRYLTERLPVMITPRWVSTRIQPIGISDVLRYLVEALKLTLDQSYIVEIGGTDILTYGEMMLGYARERGLKRFLIRVPVLTPRLSSYWVHWMTPIPANIVRPLIEGMRNEVIVRDNRYKRLFPDVQPIGYQTALERALKSIREGEVETIWSDALMSSRGDLPPVYLTQEQGMIIERREQHSEALPDKLFRTFTSLGGKRGYLAVDTLWQLRGILDRLVGGVGFRRGRRDPDNVRVGDAVDFWRVEALEPGKMLRLRAEMKVPGKAWLQFEAQPGSNGGSQLIQKAFFAPKGLFGLIYWYSLYPIHAYIFSKMAERIAAVSEDSGENPPQDAKAPSTEAS